MNTVTRATAIAIALSFIWNSSSADDPAAKKPTRKPVKLPGMVIDFEKRCVDLKGAICLEGFKYVRAEHGYRLSRSEAYADPRLVLKNSYVVMADANRLIVRVKLEEVVYIGGKYQLTKLD
ncbi:MAG: hypothetical protein VB853_08555 [Pirellulales bacterium]